MPPKHDIRLNLALWFTIALAMTCYAILAGPDTNWDLRNYHYFNGYTHLHGDFDRHILAAQFQTWHNATIDMLYVLLMQNLSPMLATIVIVLLQSLNAPFLFIIAEQILRPSLRDQSRLCSSIVLIMATIIGMTSAIFVSEVGLTYGDNITSVAVLAALASLGHAFELHKSKNAGVMLWIFISGLMLGAGVGMKLPTAVYAPGFAIGLLWFDRKPYKILQRFFVFGIAAFIGLAITDGAWAWYLWETTGSPVFPVMNGLFRSPWLDPISIFDNRFRAKSFLDFVLYPFRTAYGEHPGGELDFRDPRYAIGFAVADHCMEAAWRLGKRHFCFILHLGDYFAGTLWD